MLLAMNDFGRIGSGLIATFMTMTIWACNPVAAMADAGSFLKSLSGSWRGGGVARFPGRESEERISCRITNAYDAAASELSVRGDCATTQMKSAVQGKLNHSGNEVTGALIGSFEGSRMTKSTGTVSGNRLVVSANFIDNATGNLTRSRQIVRLTGKGFEADFYLFDNAKNQYVKFGSMRFSSK
jgi:hypothetical protein